MPASSREELQTALSTLQRQYIQDHAVQLKDNVALMGTHLREAADQGTGWVDSELAHLWSEYEKHQSQITQIAGEIEGLATFIEKVIRIVVEVGTIAGG